MDGLKPIETTTKAEASGSSALHARAETPSAPPDNFDDHLCREMAASLWRYRAFLPRDFLRDTKVRHLLSCQGSILYWRFWTQLIMTLIIPARLGIPPTAIPERRRRHPK